MSVYKLFQSSCSEFSYGPWTTAGILGAWITKTFTWYPSSYFAHFKKGFPLSMRRPSLPDNLSRWSCSVRTLRKFLLLLSSLLTAVVLTSCNVFVPSRSTRAFTSLGSDKGTLSTHPWWWSSTVISADCSLWRRGRRCRDLLWMATFAFRVILNILITLLFGVWVTSLTWDFTSTTHFTNRFKRRGKSLEFWSHSFLILL